MLHHFPAEFHCHPFLFRWGAPADHFGLRAVEFVRVGRLSEEAAGDGFDDEGIEIWRDFDQAEVLFGGQHGQCFAKRGMNDMAARKLQEALKEKLTFDAEKKELTYTLGCVLEKMGKKDEAIEQFKIIYEADIGYKDVAKRVDDYYSGQG